MKTNSHAVQSLACPNFFRALCAEARRGTATQNYATVGFEFARHVRDGLAPLDDHDALLYRRTLDEAINNPDAFWGWFKASLPRCAALVPACRKRSFLIGVRNVMEAGLLEPSDPPKPGLSLQPDPWTAL